MTINGKGDPPNLDTIIKILKMTTSDNDNIALMAIRKANAQLSAWGWEWEAMLKGKVKIMPDPFASIPTPTQAQAPSYHRAPAAPPPPPKQFDNRDEIEKYFDRLEFRKLPETTNQKIGSIRRSWNANGYLLYKDYEFIRQTANSRRKF